MKSAASMAVMRVRICFSFPETLFVFVSGREGFRSSARLRSALKNFQLVMSIFVDEVTAFFVPRTQHDALCRFAIDQQIVDCRSMGMTMNDAADAGGAKRKLYRLLIHVLDLRSRALGVRSASFACPVR